MIFRASDHGGHLCVMAEHRKPKRRTDWRFRPELRPASACLPLQTRLTAHRRGRSNTIIGTIFLVLPPRYAGLRVGDGTLQAVLQPGARQIVARHGSATAAAQWSRTYQRTAGCTTYGAHHRRSFSDSKASTMPAASMRSADRRRFNTAR